MIPSEWLIDHCNEVKVSLVLYPPRPYIRQKFESFMALIEELHEAGCLDVTEYALGIDSLPPIT